MKNAATATGQTVGFDAGKLIKGRKRLVLTDALGHVLASRVWPGRHCVLGRGGRYPRLVGPGAGRFRR
nr:hypothetical protein [Hymenobacter sedentarius]